jgi:hypothetical protein
VRARALLRVAAAAALAVAGPAAAQKPYAIPEAPAFTFLDVTPAQVSRPTTASAFGANLLNGISPTGQLQQGVAMEVAPWSFVPSLRITPQDYRDSRGKYALANTQLSLATVRGAGDSASLDLAVGLRVTFFDHSDPMADTSFTNELTRRQLACLPGSTQPAARAAAVACQREQVSALRKQWLEDRGHWNDASLSAAVAGGWRFDQGALSKNEWRGVAGWATGALPLGRGGQIVGQLRYDGRADSDADGLSYGGRGFYGSASMNAFVEVTGGKRPAAVSSRAQWTGGLEFRAAENLWISTGFGSRETAGGDTRGVLVADLRWQLSEGPRIGLPGF